MKNYICLNHGECHWADEVPPREFTLVDGEVNCPNCNSVNIREAVYPPKVPWKKIGIAAGALLLILVVVWALIPYPPKPLQISLNANCANNTVTVMTIGGDGSPIAFNSPELEKRQIDSVFLIPSQKRSKVTLTFWAVQGIDSVRSSFVTDCEKVDIPPRESGGSRDPRPPGPTEIDNFNSVVWSRVKNSEFCVSDCVVEYTEQDNLGHTRVRRINNYDKCCPAEK
ncbi:hypothetical protein [Spirosoma koreense]